MTNRLYRSQKEKVLVGVCGGVAEHLNVDPVLVRLIYILLTCATGVGPGLIVYIVAWIIVPLEAKITPSTPVKSEVVQDKAVNEPTEI
jgi:phage shock protein PspC (stress-responsive transcriptional regulator)